MRLHISLQENCFCFGKIRFSISYLKLGDSENRSDISAICKANVVFKVHTSYYLCYQGGQKAIIFNLYDCFKTLFDKTLNSE